MPYFKEIKMKKLALFLLIPIIATLSSCSFIYQTAEQGNYSDAKLIVKDYDVVELIFVDVNLPPETFSTGIIGHIFSIKPTIDKSIIEDALLKKAKDVGADDIINVRSYITKKGYSFLGLRPSSVEYHGSALAIKYKDSFKPAIGQDAPLAAPAPAPRPRRKAK